MMYYSATGSRERISFAAVAVLAALLCGVAVVRGEFNIDSENLEPKFRVKILPAPPMGSPQGASTGATTSTESETLVPMTTKLGKKYLCSIPAVVDPETAKHDADKNKQSMVTLIEYLQPKLSKLCFHRLEGWWSFEICHFSHVRQFHQDGKTVTADYSLGSYSAIGEARTGEEAFKPSGTDAAQGKPYYSTFYESGTMCDLTGRPRKAEVRIFCSQDGSNSVGTVVEPETCGYTINFFTPAICKYPGFSEVTVIENVINCWPAEAGKPQQQQQQPAATQSQQQQHTGVPPDANANQQQQPNQQQGKPDL